MPLSYAEKVIAVVGGIAAPAAIGWTTHRDRRPFGLANTITSFRALLVAFVAGFVGDAGAAASAGTATALAAVATTLDGADGWVARRTGMVTAFGARFDMEVDALLILVLAILAWQFDKAGAWVLASGLLRYGFVGAGWIAPWMRRPLAPTNRARAICVVQLVSLMIALLPAVHRPASAAAAGAGLVALAYSFGVDTWRLWQRR